MSCGQERLGRAFALFGLFRRDSSIRGATPSLDAVRFDTTGFEFRGESQPGKVKVWHTPEGDGFGVYFFPVPPDLPANIASVDELAAFYIHRLADSGAKLVEARVLVAGGCKAARTILSIPQRPFGGTYLGSLTVPFRDFSFVLKCQCDEGGPTGLKEAELFERARAANEPMRIEGRRFHIPGWDPDDPKHDVEFPDHPIARARRLLDHVAGSLVVADEVRELPCFALPSPVSTGDKHD